MDLMSISRNNFDKTQLFRFSKILHLTAFLIWINIGGKPWQLGSLYIQSLLDLRFKSHDYKSYMKQFGIYIFM